jgi:hypothetical protein
VLPPIPVETLLVATKPLKNQSAKNNPAKIMTIPQGDA